MTTYHVGKYSDRTFSVRDGDGTLIAVTVYKKGAAAVADLLKSKDDKIAELTSALNRGTQDG